MNKSNKNKKNLNKRFLQNQHKMQLLKTTAI